MLSFLSATVKSTISAYSMVASAITLTIGFPLILYGLFGVSPNFHNQISQANLISSVKEVSTISQPSSLPIITKKERIKIFLVHSYTLTHACTGPQRNGFLKTLEKIEDKYDIIIREAFMDTKIKYRNSTQIQYISTLILNELKEFKPDYIYCTDDNAFEYIGIPCLLMNYNVVASGLNRPIKDYIGELKNQNKSINMDHLILVPESVNLDPIFNLFNECRFKPNMYYILYDDSETGYYLMKEYEKYFDPNSIIKFEFIQIRTISELRKFLAKIQSEPPGVILLAIQRLYDVDANNYTGGYIDKEHFFSEFKAFNFRHLELVTNPMYCQVGFSISCGPDFYTMGTTAGEELVKVIKYKTFKGKIIEPKMVIFANGARLAKLGFQGISRGGFHSIDYIYPSYK